MVSLTEEQIREAARLAGILDEIETAPDCPDEIDGPDDDSQESESESEFDDEQEFRRLKHRRIERERAEALQRAEDLHWQQKRRDRGEDALINEEAYGPNARRYVGGELTVLPGDKKRDKQSEYLGASPESLMSHPRPRAAHSSGGGRVGIDSKREKLRKMHGRPTIDDEARTEIVSARITSKSKAAMGQQRVTAADIMSIVGKAFQSGQTFAEVVRRLSVDSEPRAETV